MTRRERLLAAIRRQPVDAVPHATYNLNPFAGSVHKDDPSYAALLAKVAASAGVLAKFYPPGIGPGLTRNDESIAAAHIEGEGDARKRTVILHTPRGDLSSVAFIPENKPAYMAKPLIASEEDAERLMALPYEPPQWDVSKVRRFVGESETCGIPLVMYTEPFSAIAKMFDFEDFCIRSLTDRPLIEKMIDWAHERCLENVRLLAEACKGLPCVLHTGGVELCTPPMLPPSLFRDLITPRMRAITEVIHRAGLLAGIHCHGRVRHVLGEMLAIGTNLLEPLEPPEQGDITLAELTEQAGDRLCLVGYIQDQEMYTAPPGHMTRCVEEIARTVGGRTGYIMTPTCTPFEHPCSEVYRRNYMEWLEAAERILATV